MNRSFIVEKDGQKFRLNFERFVSVAQKELYASKITVENLNDTEANVEIKSYIEAEDF